MLTVLDELELTDLVTTIPGLSTLSAAAILTTGQSHAEPEAYGRADRG
jgi:hypothetical protein